MTCIASLSFTFLQFLGAVILAFLVGRKLPSLEKWIIAWLFYDAMTHFSLVRVNNKLTCFPRSRGRTKREVAVRSFSD